MIHYVRGDLFDSPAQVLVNTVNTVGVMGKGIAKEFKLRYPKMFQAYQRKCENNEFEVGNLLLYKTEEKWILNFPTKTDWRKSSQIEYIEKGLDKFRDTYKSMNINSIAFPKLGCGNGGLNWLEVKNVMEKYLSDLPIEVYIYLADYKVTKPEYEDIENIEKWLADDIYSISYDEFKLELEKYIKNDKISYNDEQLRDFFVYLRSGSIIKTDFFPFGLDSLKESILSFLHDKKYIQYLKYDNDKNAISLKYVERDYGQNNEF